MEATDNIGLPDSLNNKAEEPSTFSMDDIRVLRMKQDLRHETWHVSQQMVGRVKPTVEFEEKPVDDYGALEREADMVGERGCEKKSESTK